MTTATVTSKGQITIPAEVRARLGLVPGSRLTFVATESGGYEIHRRAGSIRDLKGAVPPPAVPVSIDDMNDAIAHSAAARNRGPESPSDPADPSDNEDTTA